MPRQLSCILLALFILASAHRAAAAPARPPNVLLIFVDDLGYGDLACYGGKDLRTPHIDSLAQRGLRFETFYANSAVCSPSRAALLSGRYPELAGVPGVIRTHSEDSWGYLAPSATLLPAVLKQAGYHTALVGKWHLGLEKENTPNARGFDHFHGWLGDMMDSYTGHRRHDINYMRLEDQVIDPPGHATDLFTQWSIEYLRKQAPAAREGAKPFFLYLAYNAPHGPIEPPDEWLAKVIQREPGINPKRAKLVALIEHMDDGVGKVLAALKENGLDQNTLVIFASDNGGDLGAGATNGPLRNGKTSMYEGGLRVPMIAAWPGQIAPGANNSCVAAHMDLMPTICEVAGAAAPPGIDGMSILSVLKGNPPSPAIAERTLFFVRREGGPTAGFSTHAVRRGDWKLVYNTPYTPFELYNLKQDPKEETDLSQKAPRIRNEMIKALKIHQTRAGAVPWRKTPE